MSLAVAQTNVADQIVKAQEHVANRNWVNAEAMLVPLTQSQPQNPFIFYNLALVYENTNRIDLAKQIYQGLTNTLSTDLNQYAVVVRAPYASRMVSLVSLSQAKLNAILAKQAAIPVMASTPVPAPTMAAATNTVSPSPSAAISVPTAPEPSVRAPLPNQPTANGNNTAVDAAMKNWAKAWANKDLNNYYASYAPNFQGNLANHAAWKNQRRERISREITIEINVRNLVITTLSSTKIQAQFVQTYLSNTQSYRVDKTLVFKSQEGRWLIERESIKQYQKITKN